MPEASSSRLSVMSGLSYYGSAVGSALSIQVPESISGHHRRRSSRISQLSEGEKFNDIFLERIDSKAGIVQGKKSTASAEGGGKWRWTKGRAYGMALVAVVLLLVMIVIGGVTAHNNAVKASQRNRAAAAAASASASISSASSIAQATATAAAAAATFGLNDNSTSFSDSNSTSSKQHVSCSSNNWPIDDSCLYGFLGFSYPLENSNCNDYTNSLEKISSDFGTMRAEYGARMVRIYAPQCRTVTVWENIVQAAKANQMGVIIQVWWGFQSDQSAWKQTQSSIYSLFTISQYATMAGQYVHSASFGSEPIGDGDDGSNFISDLASFRGRMAQFGIPVGISEDWDRPGIMSGGDGTGLGSTGSQVLKNSDIIHAHIQPFYHPDTAPTVWDTWSYVQSQVKYLTGLKSGLPIMITESMWSSQQGGSHSRGSNDDQDNLSAYQTYWANFYNNCAFFKKQQVGWFVHTFSDEQEPYFGLVDSSGDSKIDGFYPSRC